MTRDTNIFKTYICWFTAIESRNVCATYLYICLSLFTLLCVNTTSNKETDASYGAAMFAASPLYQHCWLVTHNVFSGGRVGTPRRPSFYCCVSLTSQGGRHHSLCGLLCCVYYVARSAPIYRGDPLARDIVSSGAI